MTQHTCSIPKHQRQGWCNCARITRGEPIVTENRSGYTPGPWEFIGTGIRDSRGLSLASVSYANGSVSMKISNGETLANARLIAAAPEMLEIIKDLVDILADYLKYAQEMRKIGRGFSTTDTAGRVDENVLAGARVLLARIEGK